MQNKGISINEMVDVYGFRIIVDTPTPATACSASCTASTSRCRGASRITSPFRASTATSRCTRRCSGPTACRSRCRSAPKQMHRVAESGIAAHWKYKSGGDTFGGIEHDRAREWLASLVQIQEGGSSEEFLESVKVDLFPDKVYVFTPKGKILRLPTGATAVDFAYAIHTDVGNRCVAAKVDRRLVPLAHAAAQRPNRRDHHGQGRDPEPVVVEFPGDRQGARRHPPVPEEHEARRSAELGRRLLGHRARGIFAEPQEDSRSGYRRGGQRAQSQGRRRAVSRRSGSASGSRRSWRAGLQPIPRGRRAERPRSAAR